MSGKLFGQIVLLIIITVIIMCFAKMACKSSMCKGFRVKSICPTSVQR